MCPECNSTNITPEGEDGLGIMSYECDDCGFQFDETEC